MDPWDLLKPKQQGSSSIIDLEHPHYVFSQTTWSRILRCRPALVLINRDRATYVWFRAWIKHIWGQKRAGVLFIAHANAFMCSRSLFELISVSICVLAHRPCPSPWRGNHFFFRLVLRRTNVSFSLIIKTSVRLWTALARFSTGRANDIYLWGHWEQTGSGKSYVGWARFLKR